MHDLQFGKLFPVPPLKTLKSEVYKSSVCKTVAHLYAENIQLVHSMAMVPGYAFMNGENWGYAVDRAVWASTTANQYDPPVNPNDPEVQKLASKYWDKNDLRGFGKAEIAQFYEATQNAIKMACLEGRKESHGALHAQLQSLIIQAWTAYEVLAEDLWKQIIAKRPVLDTRTSNERKQSGFRSRSKLSNLYRWTFRPDNSAILSVTDSAPVHALAIMRNVVVHARPNSGTSERAQRSHTFP